MASKNIVAKGTTYNGVESVTFPTSPSGTATFFEVSDTTATASDVLNSKYFYTAAGVKTQGTGTAPSPTLITKSITANGTYDAEDDDADGYSSVTVSVSGGGGLVYETGTWTPSEDVARGEISFANTHTNAPFFVNLSDQTGTYDSTTNSNYEMTFANWSAVFGSGMYFSSTGRWFAGVRYSYRGTGATQLLANYVNIIRESGNTSYQYPGYWVDNEKFYPYADSTSRYWRAGRTYKWIAVWAPTT